MTILKLFVILFVAGLLLGAFILLLGSKATECGEYMYYDE